MTTKTNHFRRMLMLCALGVPAAGMFGPTARAIAQTATARTANGAEQGTTSAAGADKTWIVRDPVTGRLFQQRLVNVTVPVTRMEARTIEQPVYELQTEAKVQQVPQTIYKPTTQYVMQPKLRGWWNPVRQPVQAYEYIPMTSWQPQTEMVNQPGVSQRWVAKSQKIVVYQPVQSTEVRQQLVQTELPQPPAGLPGTSPLAPNPMGLPPNPTAYAAQPVLPPPPTAAARQPLISVPLLAQQRVLPWPAATSEPAAPKFGLRPVISSGPFGNASQSNYSAPLRTATSSADFSHRDALQSGMQPTVLR